MNLFQSFKVFIRVSVFLAPLLYSCSGESADSKSLQSETVPVSVPPLSHVNSTPTQFPQIQSNTIELKIFEVKDSTGKSKGWGYDIYVDNKKMIHQPIIPAIPGNNAFRTEKDAQKTGQLAVEKMKKTGSLPTLSVTELDSLGVTNK